MPTLTSKAIYQNGVVIPQIHPPFNVPVDAVVVFIPQMKNGPGNGPLVLQSLKKAQGILPEDFDGVQYENQVRKTVSQEWDNRIKENNL